MESFRTNGTCCKQIIFDVKDNKLINCKFINGCSGQSQGLARLTVGQDIDYIIDKLSGIQCRSGTSCPDQLAKALSDFKNRQAKI
ncbi:MAG: TIGR03905 family TSCPD domain-containing protein [Firmicutes bacterium]|nr:TIGR03905 family TSCPD domain-containing protein [Bacillota bacterium]